MNNSKMTEWKWNSEESGWLNYIASEHTSVIVAGLHDEPHPNLCAQALLLVSDAQLLKEQIADYLNGTLIEVYVDSRVHTITHPERPQVDIVQIEIRDSMHPKVAHIFVVTDYPDPYHIYDVTLDDRSIVKIVGGMW